MFRNPIAIFLAVLLSLPVNGYQQNSATVQEQVGKIAKGAIVEVKTKLKDRKKVQGRLGEVTADDFEVQVTQGQKVDNVKLRFSDVRAVSEKQRLNSMQKTVVVAAVVLLGLLVVGVVVGVAVATGKS